MKLLRIQVLAETFAIEMFLKFLQSLLIALSILHFPS